MKKKQIEAAIALCAMLMQQCIGADGKNQRKWQDDWNKWAKVLDGRVPSYPKKLVR